MAQGTLRIGVSTLSREQFDPYENAGEGNWLMRLIFDTLVGSTADESDLGLVGGLATKWEQSPDATSWTFYLRKGAQWDKGYGEVTAEDVKYSIDRIVFRDGGLVTDRPVYRAGIKEVVVDPYTVRVDTKTAFPDLPFMFSSMLNAIGSVVPKKAIEQMGEQQWRLNPVQWALPHGETRGCSMWHKWRSRNSRSWRPRDSSWSRRRTAWS